MTSMSRIERARLAVERGDRLAGPGAAHDDGRPASVAQIERVHRVAELEQHVVGDVDDVVDRRARRRPPAATASSQGTAPIVTSAIAADIARAQVRDRRW